jgi:3-hydroxyisobutyrate dehydrogenase/glyoxylate/succinic semialdehyde reductase
MDVAFLGMGIMGSRMAANLARAGHAVRVWNRSPEKSAALAEAGCILAASPRRAVEGVQVVFTMLSDPEAIRQVAFGAQGFLDAMAPGTVWVDHSTVDPSTSRQMGANATNRGLRFLDIPVSGSSAAAATGKLVFFAGGEASDLETISPLLLAMGSRIVHAGPVGSGAALKIVNNAFLAQAQAAWSESLGLAEHLGLSIQTVHDAILPTHVAPAFLGFKRAKIEGRDWAPEFPLKHALKDIRLALAAARETGLHLRQLEASETIYSQAASQGLGDSDISAVHEVASRTTSAPSVKPVTPGASASESGVFQEASFRG